MKTIGPDEAQGALAEVYARIAGARGSAGKKEVANILRVQSLNPPALAAHLDLYRAIMFGPSPLSRAEREAVAVAVSATNGCHY